MMKTIRYAISLLLLSSFVLAQEWTADLRVTTSDSPSLDPVIAFDPSAAIMHLAFVDGAATKNIYYNRLDAFGSPIEADRRISQTTGEARQPAIAVDVQRNKHIVWADADDVNFNYKILYTKLDASGNVVIDRRVIADAAIAYSPQVVADSQNNAHIIWSDFRNNNWELYYEKIAPDGTTVVNDHRLTNAPGTTATPSVVADAANLYVAYEDNREFDREIYYMKLDLNGNVLADVRVTNARGRSELPSIGIDSAANAYIVYSDYRDGNAPQVYLAKVNAQGSVVFERQLTSAFGWSVQASLAVLANNIHVVWQDHRDGNAEIYYQKRDVDGNPIGTERRLTSNPANSAGPVAVVHGASAAHVLWQDFRDGNWELYHKRTVDPPGVQQHIVIEGKPQVGSTMRFRIRGTPGTSYIAGLSGSLGSSFGLGVDEIFQASVSNPSVVGLERSQSQFDKRGEEIVLLTIPRRPALIGQIFYFNYAVREEGRLRSTTDPVAFTVTA